MGNITERIKSLGVVPVVKIDDVHKAVPLAKALCAGGLPCAEITFRTEQAEESIRRIAAELPDMLVGAGTVLTTEQADRAIGAGARFIVSPGLDVSVVQHCLKKSIPVFPGCATPTEIMTAVSLGIKTVKFFPADCFGGLKTLKAFSAAFPSLTFMPTGGINAGNLKEYLSFDKIIACGGSWMVNINDLATTTSLCSEAMRIVGEVRGCQG